MKIRTLVELYDLLPYDQRVIVDILRQLVIETLPNVKERISYNVPFFYGKKGICIIWPATVPRGGIKTGVLLGFWHANKMNDEDKYLTHGTNKQVFYKIYRDADEINFEAIVKLLKEAERIDDNQINRVISNQRQ